MASGENKNDERSGVFRFIIAGALCAAAAVSAVLTAQPQWYQYLRDSCECDQRYGDANNTLLFHPAVLAADSTANPDAALFWNTLTKAWLSDEQIALLKLAHEIGLADGGPEHARIVQAVLMQETLAGKLGRIGHLTAGVGKRSYGLMQVKVVAARDVLRHYEGFGRFRTDEELIVRLMTDDEFNIRVASKFLRHLGRKTETTEQMLVAYNIGLRASRKVENAAEFKYVRNVASRLEAVIEPFNDRFVGGPVQVAMTDAGLETEENPAGVVSEKF